MSRRKLDEIARKMGLEGAKMHEERTDWATLAREYREYPGTMSPFHRALCDAIVRADVGNLKRLRVAYPELVRELEG